jgi:tetratricopeptide (TPR) repeat protein
VRRKRRAGRAASIHTFLLTYEHMRWISAAALVVAVSMGSTQAFAQGIPGTRAYAAGRAGWDAIREGRNQEAAEAFALAIDAEPRDPSLHLGAGLAAYLLGKPTVARQSLERAISMSPGFTTASLLLGDILYREGDIDEAIRVYDMALKHDPANAMVKERLEKLRKEAELHSGFFQSQGAHFTVLFEGPADEQLAARALDILEGAYWRVGTALSTFPERVIPVVLYTQEQFRDITRSPQWAAGAYDGRIRIPVRGALANERELERVLTHEFTHALVQSVAPKGVPTWLNEGLAVMFEPEGESWTDSELASSDKRLTLEQLGKGFGGLSTTDARIAYAQSAAVVRALLDQGGPSVVVSILQDLARGDTFATTLERRLAMPFDAFIASLEASR